MIIAGAFAWYFLHAANPMVVWIALGLAVVGIGIILFSSSITVVANRTKGQLFYSKKRLVGGNSSTYAIGDIFRIETRKQWQVQNAPQGNQGASMPQPMLVAQSVIIFKDGRELALDHQKTSSSTQIGGAVLMGGQGAETAMAAQVAKFLNVPFQEIAPPNMGSGLNIQF
jgi:Tfp pilus assembly PilM family ATPase